MRKILFISFILLQFIVVSSLNAQNKDFNASKALNAQYNILKELEVGFVDTVNVEKLVNVGINAMLRQLDPYTVYIAEEDDEELELMRTASYGGIGSLIKKIDSLGVQISQPYFNSPASRSGLEPGDIILKINGEDVKPLKADECSSKMKGQPGTDVKFLIKKGRTGKEEEVTITRERVHIPDVSYSDILKNNIGYIRIDGFTEDGSTDVKNAVVALKEKGMQKLILDLRGNGGGLMSEAVKIVSLFVPKGTKVVSAKGRTPDSNFELRTQTEPIDTLIPIVVMVNSGSASSSEIVAGALQDLDRALIAGTKTYGKGLIQAIKPVGFNGNLKLTTSKYYTPSGRCVQAIDYSNRNSDGSVGTIADSLKKAFKTKNGRIVYDGGGITPDSLIKSDPFSRPAVSLVFNDIIGDYAIKFYKENKSIASAKDFTLTDQQYANFVDYAKNRDFDSRSSANALLDEILKAAKDEDMYEIFKNEFDALEKKLNISKEEMLKIKRDEIQPIVECEIANKYYFTRGRIESLLRTDSQLNKVLEILDKQ
jgi:C-terminal peptidase (prc)